MKFLVLVMTVLVSFGASAKTTTYQCVDQRNNRTGSVVIKDQFLKKPFVSFFLEDYEMMSRKVDHLRASTDPRFPNHALMYDSTELILVYSKTYVYIPNEFFDEVPAAGGDVTYIYKDGNLVGNGSSSIEFNFSCVLK